MASTAPSPFFVPQNRSQEGSLAILFLRRDQLIPAVLRAQDSDNDGYHEGRVINTRFGSFPHSTLVDQAWGSQVRASAVDTGRRGRQAGGRKRKREVEDSSEQNGYDAATSEPQLKKAVAAESGFVHILSPTPELWTTSLPHRTQVVYTPDYSYIIHRLRARPGTRLIEAGAGSGSFTHAAARAVFNQSSILGAGGRVFSYEFHAPRHLALQQELRSHGLAGLVELTCRDVCMEGFIPLSCSANQVHASAVFLDLPAPWLALPHLTRPATSSSSVLDPNLPIHICTFSPCIEQVQKTVSVLRQQGWIEIEMVEIGARRIETRRERVGLIEEGLRGVDDSPATVDEAVSKLREVEGRTASFHRDTTNNNTCNQDEEKQEGPTATAQLKEARLQALHAAQAERTNLYKAGRLITRDEMELKTHTSYLVFAVLPVEWSEEDERAVVAQQQAAANATTESRQQQNHSSRDKHEGNGTAQNDEEEDENEDHTL